MGEYSWIFNLWKRCLIALLCGAANWKKFSKGKFSYYINTFHKPHCPLILIFYIFLFLNHAEEGFFHLGVFSSPLTTSFVALAAILLVFFFDSFFFFFGFSPTSTKTCFPEAGGSNKEAGGGTISLSGDPLVLSWSRLGNNFNFFIILVFFLLAILICWSLAY